jgi:NADPH:quinone reductase-like Zn-dependent oxidoreductase
MGSSTIAPTLNNTTPSTMKAAVTTKAGDPEVIQLREVPKPNVKPGWVLIQVKAAGLNRAEIMTRQGHSPGITFPRILGIECVGIVEEDPSGTFAPGQQVAALMGNMGRTYDGGYAEYTLVPLEIVFPFTSKLPWATLGAIPEMFQTVAGSLSQALEAKPGEVLLIRGGTSSVGLLAGQLAKHNGLTVISTTRDKEKESFLKGLGADLVLIDDGAISKQLKAKYPTGVDKVLELVGTDTLLDSLKCIKPKGTVCMTGILGGSWTMKEFTPMGDIPNLGRLTVYMGGADNLDKQQFQDFIHMVEIGEISLTLGKVFPLAEAAEAHRYMESNQAKGKLVLEM